MYGEVVLKVSPTFRCKVNAEVYEIFMWNYVYGVVHEKHK